jgi:hypothetical protein
MAVIFNGVHGANEPIQSASYAGHTFTPVSGAPTAVAFITIEGRIYAGFGDHAEEAWKNANELLQPLTDDTSRQ